LEGSVLEYVTIISETPRSLHSLWNIPITWIFAHTRLRSLENLCYTPYMLSCYTVVACRTLFLLCKGKEQLPS